MKREVGEQLKKARRQANAKKAHANKLRLEWIKVRTNEILLTGNTTVGQARFDARLEWAGKRRREKL